MVASDQDGSATIRTIHLLDASHATCESTYEVIVRAIFPFIAQLPERWLALMVEPGAEPKLRSFDEIESDVAPPRDHAGSAVPCAVEVCPPFGSCRIASCIAHRELRRRLFGHDPPCWLRHAGGRRCCGWARVMLPECYKVQHDATLTREKCYKAQHGATGAKKSSRRAVDRSARFWNIPF